MLPVFAFAEEKQQAQELRTFLREKGAQLTPNVTDDVAQNALDLIKHCEVLGALESDNEVEMILNSLCSLIVALPVDRALEAVQQFCQKLSSEAFNGQGWSSKAGAAVRVLSNLFHGFSNQPTWQHEIYIALVKLCARADLISELPTDVETLRKYFKAWNLSIDGERRVLRMVHEALVEGQRTDAAAQVMIELLGTYTDADAGAAMADAKECVRTAVVDAKSFSLDQLLRLRPVMQLEKSDPQMHAVLKLFAEGTLADYRQFVAKHPGFVRDVLRVDDDTLVRKMRLLTLMSMAEKSSVLTFDDISKQLDLAKGEELEEFIIEAIQVNAISGKIDQIQDRLIITTFQHRSFGRAQWEQLQQRLATLSANLRSAYANLQSVEQIEAA